MRGPGLIGIVYLVVGLLVAAARGYLGGIEGVSDLLSAVLAVLLWPLVLLGFDIKIGGGGNKRAAALLVAPFWRALRMPALQTVAHKAGAPSRLLHSASENADGPSRPAFLTVT